MLKKSLATLVASALSTSLWAQVEFERPGEGFSTSTIAVGQLAWEQSLSNAQYREFRDAQQQRVKQTYLNADVLLRTGLSQDLELQLGWQGPSWSKYETTGQHVEEDSLGDVSIGLKKQIDLDDDRLSMALLAEVLFATGNRGFSEEDDRYRLASTVSYIYDAEQNIHTAISMFYDLQDGRWRATAVPTLSYQFAPKWGGYSELVYSKAEGLDYEYGLGSGVIYTLNSQLQLDASVGLGLSGEDKHYRANLGFAYAF